MRFARLGVILYILMLSAAVFGQDPAVWRLSIDDAKSPAAGRVTVKLSAQIADGWHLYAVDQPSGGPVPTSIKVTEGSPFKLAGKITFPPPITKPDPLFPTPDGKPLETRFYSNSVDFSVPLSVNEGATADQASLDVRFQLCNDRLCTTPKTVRVTAAGSTDVKRPDAVDLSTNAAAPPATQTTPITAGQQGADTQDLWPFLWLAVSLGALSLLTPCVFPMIPITVSYFTNHASGSRPKAIKLAAIYSIGIIATFTVLGMLLAIFVGASGINLFAANPWINILIAAIFLLFALNLFGAFEISVPTSLLTRLDSITRSREGEGSGVVGALLMGLTFTLTSFTCTSPFVGAILVSASRGEWERPLLGMLAFSTVFALPFFILAMAPQLISQLPRAGGWMNSVKVTMGFLEVAAAMKFISNVDLVWKWGIFTREVILSVWIAIGVVLTTYLLGKFQLSHDTKPERLGAVRLVSAVASLAISFYLLTGLFGAKLGTLESFLPPETQASAAARGTTQATGLKWIDNDHEAVVTAAKASGKRIFIDFTGYTCTNCRWMEANIFPNKEVSSELAKFELSKLFTDGEGEVYARQQQMQEKLLGTVALPIYAVVTPDGRLVASFAGLTRDPQEFIDFLQRAQQGDTLAGLPLSADLIQ